MKRILFIILILGLVIPRKLIAQVSFNDLLIVSELSNIELVNFFLIQNGFSYEGKIDKDEKGWKVDKWSFTKGIAWVEYRTMQKFNKETGKIEDLNITTFYTYSKSISDLLLKQMGDRTWAVYGDKNATDSNRDGFRTLLYFGEKSLFDQMTGIEFGYNENYDGMTAYRFLFFL